MASEEADSTSVEYTRLESRTVRRSFSSRLFTTYSLDNTRVVYVDNQLLPTDQQVIVPSYPDNTVVSSKYTIFTFLPKNLFEQFRRIANFYFLCVAGIQFVIDTPVTPMTSILPLMFVITVTAIKQGYEDWLRHKADNEVNQRPTIIIRNGKEVTARSMDINVGDIVKVRRNEEFPCDLVMLSSEDLLGQCFITTANLDGETNLKTQYCLNDTRRYNTPEELGNLRARITCKPQIADLYSFLGVLEIGSDTESKSLGPENLLLRGARLKNTAFVYGCAVYTGRDTKMALNSKSKQTKFSRVERKMNTLLLVFLVLLLLECVVSTALRYWYEGVHGVPWYVTGSNTSTEVLKVIEHALAFMVLYNYVIPISLYVTVEVQKFLGSLFFGIDVEMYDPSINERAKANTSDLNEELGQVEYLFADKTGTLTENAMVFRKCFIGKRQFEVVKGLLCEILDSSSMDVSKNVEFTPEMDEFFKVLVLCHTVRVDHQHQQLGAHGPHSSTGTNYDYQASSPDEKALVKASCRYGIVYHGIVDNILKVSFHNKLMRFKLLHILPFDANRKRMSVIVEDESGRYFLLCKGAESAILDRVIDADISTAYELINEYAILGLRTLTIAHRILSEKEYRKCDRLLTAAKLSLSMREEMLADAYDRIEQKMTLLGATAVEDKLQDQVPQTIMALRQAGIKVWVLTGDKEETAVNISYAAGHFQSNMHELHLTRIANADHCEPQLIELLTQIRTGDSEISYVLIIDGQSLAYAIKDHKEKLRLLCSQCVAVLCCRLSPMQKAEVVAMIKHSPDKPVTAAIGDGANDVSMIQEADVGFGIMGKEGRQAVRNSDYAFGKFKFVRRALLVHGHLYYHRIAVLVQYFFYKNVAWITGQVFYAIFNSFSEQSLFDPFFLLFYNLTFTSLPILIYGLFEQHLPKDELLNNPELYRKISRNATMSWSRFLRWNCLGLWHNVVIFFGILLLQKDGISIFKSGKGIGNSDFGAIIMYACVANVNLKLLLETYYWCLPTLIAYSITLIGLLALSAFYTNIYFPSWIVSHQDMYKALGQIYSTPVTWLAMLVLVVLALIPDIIIRIGRDISHQRRKLNKSICSPRSIQHTNRSQPPNCPTLVGYNNPVMSLRDEVRPDRDSIIRQTIAADQDSIIRQTVAADQDSIIRQTVAADYNLTKTCSPPSSPKMDHDSTKSVSPMDDHDSTKSASPMDDSHHLLDVPSICDRPVIVPTFAGVQQLSETHRPHVFYVDPTTYLGKGPMSNLQDPSTPVVIVPTPSSPPVMLQAPSTPPAEGPTSGLLAPSSAVILQPPSTPLVMLQMPDYMLDFKKFSLFVDSAAHELLQETEPAIVSCTQPLLTPTNAGTPTQTVVPVGGFSSSASTPTQTVVTSTPTQSIDVTYTPTHTDVTCTIAQLSPSPSHTHAQTTISGTISDTVLSDGDNTNFYSSLVTSEPL